MSEHAEEQSGQPVELAVQQLDERIEKAAGEAVAQLTKTQFTDLISQILEQKLKALQKPTERKLAIAQGGEEELSGKEAAAQFFKGVFRDDPREVEKAYAIYERAGRKAVTAPQSVGSGAAGGYTVPDDVAAEIARIEGEESIVLRLASVFPQSHTNLYIPTATDRPVVTYTNEAAAKAGDTISFGRVQSTLKKRAVWVPLTEELIEQSLIDMVGFITQLIAESFARDTDNQAFNGTGSPFTGIFSDAAVNQVTMGEGDTSFAKVDFNDLSDLIAALESAALPGAAYFMHRSALNLVRKLSDGSGSPLWAPPAGATPASIYGYPVYANDQLPAYPTDDAADTNFMAFGNLRHCRVGRKKDLRIRVSDSASVTINGALTSAFENNLLIIRAEDQWAFSIAAPKGLARLKTAEE